MNWVQTAVVGGAVGVIDTEMEALDAKKGNTGKLTSLTNLTRAGYVAVGAALDSGFVGRGFSQYGQPLVAAGMPLLAKSIYATVKGGIKMPVGNYAARRAFSAPIGIPVPDSTGGRIVVSST